MSLPTVPLIQSTICLDDLFAWLKECTETIGYGRVGVEFTIQDGHIVSYTPTLAPNIKTQEIVTMRPIQRYKK